MKDCSVKKRKIFFKKTNEYYEKITKIMKRPTSNFSERLKKKPKSVVNERRSNKLKNIRTRLSLDCRSISARSVFELSIIN